MAKFIRSTEEIVREVLIDFPSTRDCDMKLVAIVWHKFYKNEHVIDNMTARDLLKKIHNNKLPHVVSIVRSRQKIQQLNTDCRGNKYNERHDKIQKEVKQEIKTWKHDDYKQPGLF